MKKLALFLALVMFLGCAELLMTADKRRKNYVKPRVLDERTEQAILNGKIFIGMSKREVKASWGSPDDINRTVTSYGTSEQWVYSTYDYSNVSYLYFDDGKLTSWQN